MSIRELNEKSVEELENMCKKDGYRFLICDGIILWYMKDDEQK